MSGAVVAAYRKLGGLEQQKLVVLQFWGPEVWNHGVGGAAGVPACGSP